MFLFEPLCEALERSFFLYIDIHLRWTPHPVIVAIMDDKDYVRVLSYSYYATITGWEVLLTYTLKLRKDPDRV